MSKENLAQFMNQVADSEELQAKIGEEIDAEDLIALGAECGCEFTAEELQESAELGDGELEGISGGPHYKDYTPWSGSFRLRRKSQSSRYSLRHFEEGPH